MVSSPVPTVRVREQAGSRVQGSVLVVDGDEVIRTRLMELFRAERVQVRGASSGQAAMVLAKQAAPDLLIVDVSLPDQNGIRLLEEALRIDSRMIGVVMTESATVELAVQAMKAGASDFLVKPVRNEVALATVGHLLELHRMRAESQVLKPAALRSGSVRLQNLPFQVFGDDGPQRGADGLTEYERGLAEGQRQVEALRRQDLTVLTDAARKFDDERMRVMQTVEEDVIALAFGIASKVLREFVETAREPIVQQTRAALGSIRDPGRIVIQVHPADAQILEAVRAELAGQVDLALTISVEPVASLSRGSCLVHTATRLIDASLDTQLYRLGHALKSRTHGDS